MNETSSVTGSSLAIAEKRPRRTGGCVGIFLQLFDWNRRFAKKKLFSKRLLPPDRAKEASKKFGGDEKLPKLRLIADENSGGFPNMNKNGVSSVNTSLGKKGVEAPSLIARLMGLESMPSDKRLKDSCDEFRREKVVGESEELEKETTRQDFRPQKLQKTGMLERRSVTRFGAEALQLKAVLSRSRKHHHPKLSSPVKTSSHHARRSTSRLIGAATRILEPTGKAKPAITYPHSARRPPGNEPFKAENLDLLSRPACKNCGNLLDIAESTSHPSSQVSPNGNSRYTRQEPDLSTNTIPNEWHRQSLPQNFESPTYLKENCGRQGDVSVCGAGVSSKDFVALNRSLSGRTRSRVPDKVEDTKFDKRSKFESGDDNCSKRQMRKQGENRARMVGKQMRPDERQTDYLWQNGRVGNKNSDGTSIRFNSHGPSKVERRRNGSPCKPTTSLRKKCTSNQSDEKMEAFPLTGDSLGALLQEKLNELRSQMQYESSRNGTPPANIFQELIRALNMERPFPKSHIEFCPQRNQHCRRYDRNTRIGLQTNSERTGASIGYKNNDHLSPGSVLEATFSNDSCSLEDSSVRTQHADSMSYSYDDSQLLDSETDPFYSGVSSTMSKEKSHTYLVADLLAHISRSIIDLGIKGEKRAHVTEVIFNAELVLGNPNEINSFFLLELDTLAEVMWMRFGNTLGSYQRQLKRIVFDCLIEYLESKYGQYSKCGFRAWTALPPFMGSENLVHEVVEEVSRWMGFVGVTTDEVLEGDMSHCLGKWTDFEIEAYETGTKIEREILQMLVDEMVVDFSSGVGCLCCVK